MPEVDDTMRILTISAANMVHAKKESISLEACLIIEKIIKTKLAGNDMQMENIRLVDAALSPCTGCGKCFKMNKCWHDDCFNNIYTRIAQSDALFIVSPHYAPIPARLCMLLEKMEQISFLNRFHDINYYPLVHKIPVGIIAHGGGSTEAALRSYKEMVLDTIANALRTIMMEVVGLNEEWPTGVAFPVKEVLRDEDGAFPVQLYDRADIENRLTPLVLRVVENAFTNTKNSRVLAASLN
jgi:multimeric flavodoxin WrbA